MSDTYTGPSHLATDIAATLWDNHRDCPAGGDGHCTLGHISTDDVQEVIDLAKGPVVAAELRRIADVLDSEANAEDGQEESDQPFNYGLGTAVKILRGRADELDPPATEED